MFYVFLCCVFFFFKQKTAYEMRISDWSSDVCSSDLVALHHLRAQPAPRSARCNLCHGRRPWRAGHPGPTLSCDHRSTEGCAHAARRDPIPSVPSRPAGRSEEHTSELQSLMRISYAVFCLKKKNTYTTTTYNLQDTDQ